MDKKLKKELNKWIEERKKELKKAKTKFQENNLNGIDEIVEIKQDKIKH